jgi:two-component system, sensor histidine kinase
MRRMDVAPDSGATSDMAVTASSAVELQLRREVLALTVSRAAPVALAMWLIFSTIAWLGWNAGIGWPTVALFVAATVSAGWRLAVVRARRRAPEPDLSTLRNIEFLVQANMLFAGLMWAFASITIYPRLDPSAALVYLSFQFVAVAFAALFSSVIKRGFAMITVPSIAALLVVMLVNRGADAALEIVLVAVYAAIMTLASRSFRHMTLLALRRGLEMHEKNIALGRAIAAAQASAAAKTRFLATMSHELRTPMAGLLGALDLLHHARLSDTERRVLDMARTSGTGLLNVINDVLDYAKVDSSQIAIRSATVSPRELLESVAGLFTLSAVAKGLLVTVDVAPGVPEWVQADGHRLRQVLSNIVGNAVKFTERGTIDVRARPAPEGLRFEIQDTGFGIAREDLGKLFQPFQQLDERGDRSYGGTGLGLAISQRLVQAMGGTIEVNSVPEQGTCFGFTLALPAAMAPATSAHEQPQQPTTWVQFAGHVLLVDDNEVNRYLAVQMLGMHGLSVIEARDGVEALEQLRARSFDLVLMDCEMPRKNGYNTVAEWREQETRAGAPRVPVLAISANVMPEHLERAIACGMDEVLTKPFGLEQLSQALARWLVDTKTARPTPRSPMGVPLEP